MPQREESPIGAPCWLELMSADPDLVTPFYSGIFGWNSERSIAGDSATDYITFYQDGRAVAGLARNIDPLQPDTWLTYFRVADVDTTAAQAQAAGGAVLVAPQDVEEMGRFAVLADNEGAAFGLWQAGPQHGFEVHGEPGAPVWTELATAQFEKAQEFYGALFGWTYQPLSTGADFTYATIHIGPGEAVGGIFGAPGALPQGPSWQTYLGTADTDATSTQVVDLGGAVVEQPVDTEYGRIARIADPLGAVLVLSSVHADPTGHDIALG